VGARFYQRPFYVKEFFKMAFDVEYSLNDDSFGKEKAIQKCMSSFKIMIEKEILAKLTYFSKSVD
jgi:hypothetical protein